MAEKVLAFCIGVILVTGKLRLEMQMKKDRENGLYVISEEYRYGKIIGRYIRDLKERFRKSRDRMGEN